ncbi:MAG: glutathione-disulfide reductase [Burkholderiaceae bacterium]
MSNEQVDLFVIGAGSGGVRAARIAANHGAKVAVAESFRFGGTCVIRGCVPKKLMVLSSRLQDEFDRAPAYGWDLGKPQFDWNRLRDAKEAEITRLEGIYQRNLEGAGVKTYATRAFLTGPNSVQLESTGQTIEAGKILIATGGWPSKTDIPGADLAITSNEIFDLPELPDAMVIEGGGFIGVEFACVMQRLGVAVTLVYRGEQILRGFDDDLRNHLCDAMREAGVNVLLGTRITGISGKAGALSAKLDNGNAIAAGQIMLATGRKPNVQDLGLAKAGVELNDKGAIKVSSDSKTTADNIWAVGDVTNRLALTPVAIREGHAFADTVFGNNPWTCDHETVPSAVFSTPEIGTVGISEAQAREQYGAISIFKSTFRPMTNVLCDKPERMLMKIIVDKASDRVLGVHICGPDAAEMVQMAAIAMKMGATKAQFDATVALHPSAAEELVTMRTPVSD